MTVNVILGSLVDIPHHCASHGNGHVLGARVALHLAVERVHLFDEGGVRGCDRPHLLRLVCNELVYPRDVERVFVRCCVSQLDCKRQL